VHGGGDGRGTESPCADKGVNGCTPSLFASSSLFSASSLLEVEQSLAASISGGTRAAGTEGFNQSRAWLLDQLQDEVDATHDASLTTTYFSFESYGIDQEKALVLDMAVGGSQVLSAVAYVDWAAMRYSPSASIANAPFFVAADEGCVAKDYDGLVVNQSVVLVPRGAQFLTASQRKVAAAAGNAGEASLAASALGAASCTIAEKLTTAAAAGAVGIVFESDPSVDGGLFSVGLPEDGSAPIPAVAATTPLSTTLRALATAASFNATVKTGLTIDLNFTAVTRKTTTSNTVLTIGTDADKARGTLVLGSHLDSVPAGPGINDNGSGSSANLQFARTLLRGRQHGWLRQRCRVIVGWWGAEELGLLGSAEWVAQLNATGNLTDITANMNFDMLGSPNGVYGVYNASTQDGTWSTSLAARSAVVQRALSAYYEEQGLPIVLLEFDGRSDYGPFLEANVAAGGLAAGAEELKTVAQRDVGGGLANAPLDPCYHQACDTVHNLDLDLYENTVRAAAHALYYLAVETKNLNDLVNGAE
jgi:hypothetical protein